MKTTYNLLRSRTFWTGIIMFIVTWGPGVSNVLPAQWKPLVDGILTILMFYFHNSTAQKAGAVN